MILNLGSGDDPIPGCTNVDLRDGADVQCDVFGPLPFPDESVEMIQAFDILEHAPRVKMGAILFEWRRILKRDGTLVIRVPNMHALAVQLTAAERAGRVDQVEAFIRNIMGGHRWGRDGEWDCHHHNFTETTLRITLAEAGFEVLEVEDGLNMRVTAVPAPDRSQPVP